MEAKEIEEIVQTAVHEALRIERERTARILRTCAMQHKSSDALDWNATLTHIASLISDNADDIPEDVVEALQRQRQRQRKTPTGRKANAWVKPGVAVYYASTPTTIWTAVVDSEIRVLGSELVVHLRALPAAYKAKTGRTSVASAAVWALYPQS